MKIDICNYDVFSFDIFDTLLFRATASASDIFMSVWDCAKTENICGSDISSSEFMKIRIEMERRARNKSESREVTLENIYSEFPDFLCQKKHRLMELEVEQEIKYCYANPEILDLIHEIKKVNKPVVLVSDMYLVKEDIIRILEKNNINTDLFTDIIISCEKQRTKQSGQLFQDLLSMFPTVNGNRILHIGDNKTGDYEQAVKSGICAIHYDVIPEKKNSVYEYEKILHGTIMKELISLRKLAASQGDQSCTEKERAAYEIGASVIGPVLILYVSWVADRMNTLGRKHMYPLMREGYLLGELLKKEVKDQNFEMDVKPIYVSRKVTYIPSIEKVTVEEIENMLGARNLTVKDATLLFGMEWNEFGELEEFADVLIKESHQMILGDGLSLKETLIKKLYEKKDDIARYIETQRALLCGYLLQEVEDLGDFATMDVGFFGRIQLWMEKALTLSELSFHTKHFLTIGIVGDKIYDGYDYEGFLSTFHENQDLIPIIHRTTDVLEKLISVGEGSTIGYKKENGKISPVKAKEVNGDEYRKFVFEGIYNFQKHWFTFRKEKPNLASNVLGKRREVLMVLHRLIDMPRKQEVSLLASFEGDTNFGTEYCKLIISEEDRELVKTKGVDYVDHCNVSYTFENSNIVWPKGVVTEADEYYYVRKALKRGNGSAILQTMQTVVERMKEEDVKEISLYGAGENGRQFLYLCELFGIQARCFIDRKESMWGTTKEGIPVMGLQEAYEKGYRTFLITSLFSISEIKDKIIGMAEEFGEDVLIYSV